MDSKDKVLRLSIIIPVYRGATSIGPLVDLLVDALRQFEEVGRKLGRVEVAARPL